MSDKDQLYTTKEACAYLRVSRETLRLLNPKREYVGARPRYRRGDLDKIARRRPQRASAKREVAA